jgi:chromosomal replication initiation ATPase DnaA
MWQGILAQLELQLTRATFASLLQESHGVDCREGVLIVAVPNGRVKDWLEARLMPIIERTVGRTIGAGGKAERVRFVVREEQSDERTALDDARACQGRVVLSKTRACP